MKAPITHEERITQEFFLAYKSFSKSSKELSSVEIKKLLSEFPFDAIELTIKLNDMFRLISPSTLNILEVGAGANSIYLICALVACKLSIQDGVQAHLKYDANDIDENCRDRFKMFANKLQQGMGEVINSEAVAVEMIIGDLNKVEKKQNYHLIFALNPRFEELKNSNSFFSQGSVTAALAFKNFFSMENLSARLAEEGVAFIACDSEDEAKTAYEQISETKPLFIKQNKEIVVVSNNVEFAKDFYLHVVDGSKDPNFRR